ncbi:type II toxin-antitoxin system MqsA family antitoxin [Pluralibacter gergoviae]|uniref:Type II toxin-antitoxin system MqsA family antitoxin n=1 Tax=Pluralibacter gergoviae TaxID=61647 RepID=A0AAW8HM70_PLUGE|nr:type II toxin-antitoxin system MqsA family antitoxin [Pluralibacter gergoviae]AVR04788.1 type II toxin-antitoxin system MqsA family antitoxin [Pluralibacter gergoviae]MDQ2309552.1 type II toxin-antitoxin system MqsA family antitoxin [Pluralibacter gergoviae]SUB70823.1 Antitoxin MqsA [Pluralibacter gergoviae]HDS1117747.1 type II toxin-antitoxin system MqsA family antitoxin [Pluralibacter gergoviae]
MKEQMECPVCGEGHLTRRVQMSPIIYRGVTKQVEDHFSVCDACGLEQADAKALKQNKRAVIKAKKEVDGLLSGAEVLAIRKRLGINQEQASRIFGGGPTAFTKYENDDVAQSEAMDKLIRVADEFPVVFNKLCACADVVPASAINGRPGSASSIADNINA